MEDRRGSKYLPALALSMLWCLIAAPGIVGGLLISSFDTTYCAAPTGTKGSSYDIGELDWSLVPAGPRCTWADEQDGSDRTRGPSPIWTMWLLTLLILGWLIMRAARGAMRVAA